MPFEPDLSWARASTEDEDPHAGLPDLVREHSEYKSEDEKENRNENEGVFMSKLSHISKGKADCIVVAIKSMIIAAWSLDDLRPADVPLSHSFELIDDTLISHAARTLPPKHNAVVREEIYKDADGRDHHSLCSWVVISSCHCNEEGRKTSLLC